MVDVLVGKAIPKIIWKEIERTLDPHLLYLSSEGRGGITFTYATCMYRIREIGYDEQGKQVAVRERFEPGKPLYEHKDPLAGTFMRAIRPLMDTLRSLCWQNDEKLK